MNATTKGASMKFKMEKRRRMYAMIISKEISDSCWEQVFIDTDIAVWVFSHRDFSLTKCESIAGEHKYSGYIGRYYSPRYCSRLARAFAAEVRRMAKAEGNQ